MMSKLELRDLAEQLFTIACNYPPHKYERSYKVPSDRRRLEDMEEVLEKAFEELPVGRMGRVDGEGMIH